MIAVIFAIILILAFVVYFILKQEPEPEKMIDPSAPGVHYYEECDYSGKHSHTDKVPSKVEANFKSIRVSDDFAVRAYSTTDQEVFIKGPSTVKCTPFKKMDITPN
jgi:hypothetical protein